jgi:hypothetical protein
MFLHFRINELREDIRRTEASLNDALKKELERNTLIVSLFLAILSILLALPWITAALKPAL